MSQQEHLVKWVLVREVIHLGYDYINNEATQWEFICNINNEDLKELYYFNSLQKYTKRNSTESNLCWDQINQLIKLECEFRKIII